MERGSRKVIEGVVLKNKMDKTVVVQAERTTRHPVFKKVVRLKSRFKAHDEKNECQIGDKVKIMECRPLSKDKRWRVVEIVGKSPSNPGELKA